MLSGHPPGFDYFEFMYHDHSKVASDHFFQAFEF